MEKEFKDLFWPIMMEQFFLTLMGNIDTIILSGYSDGAVAASGMANNLLILGFLLLNIIGIGSTILLTNLKGRKNERAMGKVMTSSLGMSLFFSIALSLLFYLPSRNYLTYMNTPEDILADAIIYMQIIALSLIPQGIGTAITSILRCQGKVKLILYVTIMSNLMNLIGNSLVIFTPFSLFGKGVRGVAMVTLISRIIANLILFFYYYIYIRKKDYAKFSLTSSSAILKLGLPSGLENVAYNFSQTLLASIIAILGTTLISSRIYTFTITGFVFSISMGISMAVQILTGVRIGEGKKEEAYKLVLRAVKSGIFIVLVFASLIAILSPYIIRIFTKDEVIRAIVPSLCMISILLEPLRCVNCVLIAGLTSSGDVKYPVIVGIIAIYFINLPLSYLVVNVFKLGLYGLFFCAILDEALRALIFKRRWDKKGWMKLSLGGDL